VRELLKAAAEYHEGMNGSFAMCRRYTVWIVAVVLAAAGVVLQQSAAQQAAPGARLVLLDGRSVVANSLAIADGKLSGDGVPVGLTLDDVQRIELPRTSAAPAQNPAVIVELRGGGRLLGKSATIGNDKCLVDWLLGQNHRLSLPIDVVRALRFDSASPHSELAKAVAAPTADADRIFFNVESKTDSIAGLIESLTAEQLTFQFEGQERTLRRDRLIGIALAQAQAEDEAPRCLVSFRDGSRLAGGLLAIKGELATLELPGGGQVAFPWWAVARVDFRSSRVAFLSDLKPVGVDESPLVTLARPWQRDKSVMGRPLMLGTRVFEKGIGVHSRSALTFAVDGKYDVLAAAIGIDAGAAGKGDCIFNVLGDGQSIFSRRMKGTDPPHDLQIDISRFAQVTLLVEPGADLDLADHADWCDARLIRNKQ
jgi:hypothetical protein